MTVQLGIMMDLTTMRPEPDSPQGGPVQSARFRSVAPVSDIARRGWWHREVRGHDASAWAVRVSRTNFFAAVHPPGFPGSPGHHNRRTWPMRVRREDRSRLTMGVSSRLLSPPEPSATRRSTSVNGLVRLRNSPPRRRRHRDAFLVGNGVAWAFGGSSCPTAYMKARRWPLYGEL